MKRKKPDEITLSFTSMTDMVFLLLTFFMIGVSFSGENTKLDVNLPKSKAVSKSVVPKAATPFTIEIDRNDNLALNGDIITFEELDVLCIRFLARSRENFPACRFGNSPCKNGLDQHVAHRGKSDYDARPCRGQCMHEV